MTQYANRGRELETAVLSSCAIYRARKLAVIQKVATPARIMRDGTAWRERSTVDFIGRYLSWPVAFDCKHISGKRWQPSKSHDHQEAFLRDWSLSGVAFWLMEWTGRKTFAVTVKALADRRHAGLTYTEACEMVVAGRAFVVERGTHGVPIDFGAAVVKMVNAGGE